MANPLIWMMLRMPRPQKENKTKQGFTRKVKYIFLFHSGVRNRGEKATEAVLESKTPVSLVHYYIFPERLCKKILLSCDLYRCS